MPVFDFNNTPDKKQECVCTYTVLHSNEKAATPERPMLVLDNSRREWKHHSCGVFANQARQTAFEFKEKDGTLSLIHIFISYALVIFEPIQQLARLLADLISCQANICLLYTSRCV